MQGVALGLYRPHHDVVAESTCLGAIMQGHVLLSLVVKLSTVSLIPKV